MSTKLNFSSISLLSLCLCTFAHSDVAAKEFIIGDDTTVSIYGQINHGAPYVDDGQANELFGTVDNDNSSTRIGIRTSTPYGSGWIFSSNLEVQYEPASTFSINILDQTDSAYRFDENSIRKVEITFAHQQFGKLSLGQGSLASDGAAEVDLSGKQHSRANASTVYPVLALAMVSQTENQAREQNLDVVVTTNEMTGWFSWQFNAETVAWSKVLASKKGDQIVGEHIIGHHAEELVHLYSFAMAHGITVTELRETPFAFLTFSSDLKSMF